MKKMERINQTKFEALTTEESALIQGGAGCTLSATCTISGGRDALSFTDTISL